MSPQKPMSRGAREAWGRWAESLAAWSLRLRGYRIVARRFRTPQGEIDLVARRGRLVAFVEVKARIDLEQALAALGPHQRERTARAAAWFLARHPSYAGHALRFDLVAVRPWRMPRHLIDAWRLDDRAALIP
jgi:putative endonuclease